MIIDMKGAKEEVYFILSLPSLTTLYLIGIRIRAIVRWDIISFDHFEPRIGAFYPCVQLC